MDVTLTPLSEQELARLRDPLERAYAEDLAAHQGMSPQAARERSADQLRQLLPAGAATEGVLLRMARVGDTEVGWIWVTLPGAAGATDVTRAWIHNIEVQPAHRGRGYARRMIQLMEAELARLGVPELGLNVFGTNTVAIGLYQSLGFQVTAQQMAKRIDRRADPAATPVP
ncbi:GNAT family N-acetyltransferase [Micromonospora sp. NPDC047527]|uniref:GNAT family N-acetyltransferase n=1 Tax=unclassified Micromonospora TaxID=2617518 RepID=UPI0033CD9F52